MINNKKKYTIYLDMGMKGANILKFEKSTFFNQIPEL